MRKNIFTILLTCMVSSIGFAQEEQEFKLKDGTKLKGIVLEETDSVIKIATSFGTIDLQKENIVKKWVGQTPNKVRKKNYQNEAAYIRKWPHAPWHHF